MSLNQQQQDFLASTDKMQAHLDSFIDSGTDQELFIASYLHGHFDVAVANTEKQIESQTVDTDPLISLRSRLTKQLAEAFQGNELSDDDAEQVKALVNKLFTHTIV